MTQSLKPNQLAEHCRTIAKAGRDASRMLANLSANAKNAWLEASADALLSSAENIQAANRLDVAAATDNGLSEASIDRLRLDPDRIASIADGLRQIAALPDPIGETLDGWVRPNGLEIRKVRVPLGCVFFIYESRPNVTADAAAICVKSGNAVILRGGKEARHSSAAVVDILQANAACHGIPEAAVQLVGTTDREAVGHFLALPEFIDVAIPRGGKGLIERVVTQAKMPVLKHFDGNCHVFVDASADPIMGVSIVVNSKCQRLGVCNACESLLIHRSAAKAQLPSILEALAAQGIEIRGDEETCKLFPAAVPATEQDWSTEYLGPTISCRVVESVEEAIEHINRYGSHHTDAIVTANLLSATRFQHGVDSAAVVVNASTRFNDGGEFGFGAEIGISTDKFHARGPCGLKELTTYKYLVLGNGQIR